MKQIVKEPNSPRARDIISDLSMARIALSKLRNQGKDYDNLIDEIMAIGEEDPLPSSKDLQAKLNLTSAKLKKRLDQLYEDFRTAIRMDANLLQFPTVEHCFCVYGYRGFFSFVCQLPFTPRVGEDINIPFVKGAATTTSFYVYKVDYELCDTILRITIWLKTGFYNQHYEYAKDRAILEGNLGSMAEFNMSNHEITQVINKLYKNR